jgi:hypothetical protein
MTSALVCGFIAAPFDSKAALWLVAVSSLSAADIPVFPAKSPTDRRGQHA